MQKYIIFFLLAFIMSNASAEPYNSSTPVEITADSLEVIQEQNKAIFLGDVQAKQGDIDIRSEKMTVFYNEDVQNKKDKNQSKISKVEVERNVFITTPKEVAQGDKGVYNVDDSMIILSGNVSLSSGKNIVKGEKLVYNLKTGQSRMVSSNIQTIKGGKKTRVKGVFVPGGS